ncbi:metal-dependent transcriptional regulator [bacterium]|nr:metal-dependent transcriptional regulator [bacterium]
MRKAEKRTLAPKEASTRVTLSAALESYLEHIHGLQLRYGAVRVSDLAKKVGCRMPTVTSTLRRLGDLGLVNYEKYRPVTLTQLGVKAVKRLDIHQKALTDFLTNVLGVEDDLVEEEACFLEHHFSTKLLSRIRRYMEFIRSVPSFQKFLNTQRAEFVNFLSRNSTSSQKDQGKSEKISS